MICFFDCTEGLARRRESFIPLLGFHSISWRGPRPIIGSERGRWQSSRVEKISGWVVRPIVAHGNGRLDFWTGDDHGCVLDLGVSPVEFSVDARDGESLQSGAPANFQGRSRVLEMNDDASAGESSRIKNRPRVDDLFTVNVAQSPQRQSLTHLPFSRRVHVPGLS
jgi:hypothetical protein